MKFSIASNVAPVAPVVPPKEVELRVMPSADGSVTIQAKVKGSLPWASIFMFSPVKTRLLRGTCTPESLGFSLTEKGEVLVSDD